MPTIKSLTLPPPTANLPPDMLSMINSVTGGNPAEMGRMIELASAEVDILPEIISQPKTMGDWVMFMGDKLEVRPEGDLTYETIERMRKSGVIEFLTKVRQAGIVAPFRSQRTWLVESPDKKLESYMTAALDRMIFSLMAEATDSMLPYGVAFFETVWGNATAYQLGLSNNRNASVQITVPLHPKSVNPRTIKGIKRDKQRKFDGFIQQPYGAFDTTNSEIDVARENSLIFTYNGRFRNLWGHSLYEPLKDYWFWYQVVLRAMVRYMERIGTPVTVVRAPSRRKVRKPGSTTEYVDSMVWGLNVAGQASKSSALVIPSDKDDNGGEMWDISYLTSSESSQPYVEVLDMLTKKMLRSAVITDTSVTATDNAPYSMTRIHNIAKQAQDVMVIASCLNTINDHYLPWASYYNQGSRGAPVRMYAKMADASEMEELVKLFSVAGNSPFAQEDLGKIDYRKAAEDAGIPFLSEAEFEEKKKRVEEERQKALEMQQKAMQQAAGPQAKQEQAAANKEENGPPQARKTSDQIKNELDFFGAILDSGYSIVPLQLDELIEHGAVIDDGVIQLKKSSFKESQVKRDNRGRFAGRKGGGGGGGGSSTQEKENEDKDTSTLDKNVKSSSELAKNVTESQLNDAVKKNKPGLFRARNVAIGGVAAGVLLLMNQGGEKEVVLPDGTETPTAGEGKEKSQDSAFDPLAAKAEVENKLKEVRGRYSDNYPTTPQEAQAIGLQIAKELGIDEGMVSSIDISYGDVPEGFGGMYNPVTGEITLSDKNREVFDKHMSLGTPDAINLMFHEMLHSRQPSGSEETIFPDNPRFNLDILGKNPLQWPNGESKDNHWELMEGNNELMSHVMTSAYIGRPVGYFEKEKITQSIMNGEQFLEVVNQNPNQPKEWYDNSLAVISDMSPNQTFADQGKDDHYRQGLLVYAGLSELKSRKEGGSSWEHAKEFHQEGYSYQYQVSQMARLFPDRMKDYKKLAGSHEMPSISTLQSWISEEGIDMEDAVNEITEEALR